MPKNVVAMTLMPGGIKRGGSSDRNNTDYYHTTVITWQWWCKQHDVEFIFLNEPSSNENIKDLSPTYQRWAVLPDIFKKYEPGTKIAVVDADTMIKWDTPNFFNDLPTNKLNAVLDPSIEWAPRSMQFYSPLFPGIELKMNEYINCGMVILDDSQVPFLEKFIQFVINNKEKLLDIQNNSGWDVGSDQTPFNLFRKMLNHPVNLLPRAFNRTWCFGDIPYKKEYTPEQIHGLLNFVVFKGVPEGHLFDFMKDGYIWHFNSSLPYRDKLIAESWRRVSKYYT